MGLLRDFDCLSRPGLLLYLTVGTTLPCVRSVCISPNRDSWNMLFPLTHHFPSPLPRPSLILFKDMNKLNILGKNPL